MAKTADSTPAPAVGRRPVPAASGTGRRSLFGAVAALAVAPAATLAAPAADWATPHLHFGSEAEQRLWRCLGVTHLHFGALSALLENDAPEPQVEALLDIIEREIDRAAAIPADTREAFRLKAMIVHKHGDMYAGERVLASLLSDLMAGGGGT